MIRKFFLPVFLLAILVAVGAGCSQPSVSPKGNLLFYRDDCPHCKNVEAFMDANKVREKLSFDMLEVATNRDNANLMLEKAKICNLPTDRVGVPFFWDGTKCIVGDTPIIEYFTNELKK